MNNPKPKVGVGVMVLKGDKLLLGLRSVDPAKADSELHGEGTWTMPGGKMEFGEEPHETAARELLEETGMRLRSCRLVSVSSEHNGDAHFVTLGFLCDGFEGEPKVMEPDEITEWKWFPLKELPRNLFVPSRSLLNNYFAKKVY
jgi:8-oxo-dGTP diphosphatase